MRNLRPVATPNENLQQIRIVYQFPFCGGWEGEFKKKIGYELKNQIDFNV